jgi:hypothetical protein
VNLLGGSYRRHNSQHRRNRGDDMRQPTHLAGFVQPYRVAKRKVVRPNTATRSFTDRDERRQLIGRTINLWPVGNSFPQEKLSSYGFGASPSRLVASA